VEGKNLIVERRYAQFQGERLANSAQELARMNLNAVVTVCTFSTKAALSAMRTTPIVMLSVSDPVGLGLAASLPRPGNNVTGRSSLSRELIPKMTELTGRTCGAALPDFAFAQSGLLATGGSVTDAYRQAGIYPGRILKGEKPGDCRLCKVRTGDQSQDREGARLEIPDKLLALADKVIE
jgi:ABC transporter substrate binding protein